MIYKYNTENNILKAGSLFQIPFKSANGYSVKIDDKVLVEDLDYTIDGSRLWIERDIAGSVFSISDNVEDETEVLLNKIGQVETALSTLKASVDSNKIQLTSLLESLERLQQLQTEKDNTYTDLFETLQSEIDTNTTSIDSLSNNTNKELETCIELVTDVEGQLTDKITAVLNTSTSNHSALQKEMAGIYDRLSSNDTISLLNLKYEELSGIVSELKTEVDNIPTDISSAELNSLSEKLSSLKQSLAMETAQRIRADKEIKLLLDRFIDKVEAGVEDNAAFEEKILQILEQYEKNSVVFQERILQLLDYYKKDYDSKISALDKRVTLLEDIIVAGDDADKAELMFNEYKKEITARLSDMSRITTANITRLEKLRHKVLGFDFDIKNDTGVIGKKLEERLEELKRGGAI